MRFRPVAAAALALGCSLTLASCGSSELDGKYEYIGNEGSAQIEIDGDEFSITTDGTVFSGSVDQDEKIFTLEHMGEPGDEKSLDDEMESDGLKGEEESFSTKDDQIIYQGCSFVKVDD